MFHTGYHCVNIVISPTFLVWKFCGKAQFLESFGRFAQTYAETVPLHKVSTPGNLVKLRYFTQCTVDFNDVSISSIDI